MTDGRVLGLPSTLGGVPLETRLAELGLGDGNHPRFFNRQLGSAVGAIAYVRGSGN